MELHLYGLGAGHREPDWVAAAVSGFAAGAVLMVLELVWTASTGASGESPWRVSQLVAALTLGPRVLSPPAQVFDFGLVGVALITHYVLGVLFGLVLGAILAGMRSEPTLGRTLAIGGAFGVLLYFLNFYLLSPLAPWFAELRGWSTVIGHLVFGMSGALLYTLLARPGRGSLQDR